jgi:PAS domain S-box-containing protein
MAQPILDEGGNVVKVLEGVTDITERKQAEEEIETERAFLSTVLDNIVESIVICDAEGQIIRFNEAARRLHGVPEQPIPPDQWAEYYDLYQADGGTPLAVEDIPLFRALHGERVHDVEIVVKPAHSEPRSLVCSGQALTDKSDQVTGAVVTMHDITARKQAEEALRASKAILAKAEQMAHLGSWEWDVETDIFTMSEGWQQVHGCDSRQLPSEKLLPIAHPDDRARIEQALDQALEGQQPYVIEHRIIRQDDGEVRTIQAYGEVVRDAHGDPIKMYGAAQDITERKRAEEELGRYAAELKRSNEELEQFAYVISHDLHEPARMVNIYLDLLENRYQGQLDERADMFIDYAADSAERMQEMINALLDLSRVGTRGETLVPTDVEGVLERTLRSLGWAIEEANAEVTHDPLPTVLADQAQLAQVFQNLVANGIKFCKEDVPPHVHVSAEQENDEWVFSVADNGIGIDPEQTERLFQIFQRLHTREEYEGTGMGLALCKRIVERHGGRIWVESKPGEGSTFIFTLPA